MVSEWEDGVSERPAVMEGIGLKIRFGLRVRGIKDIYIKLSSKVLNQINRVKIDRGGKAWWKVTSALFKPVVVKRI